MKTIMKKILVAFTFFVALFQSSCTDDLDELNTDPTRATAGSFDANLLLPASQYWNVNATSGYQGSILFQSMWVQILASTSTGGPNYYSNGDKYVISSNTNAYIQSTWDRDFRAANYAYDMEQLTKGVPSQANLNNIAIIMQAECLATLSDVYGDIPFTEALQAKTGITSPGYDSQENIYKTLLTRLETAVGALNPSLPGPTSDAYAYKGDINKWKKFGYSLMLKLAMRLVKADATTAKTYAEKAVAGGVFTSVDDDAYFMSDNAGGYGNSNAAALIVPADVYQVRWSKTLIDYLKANNDPRLAVAAEVPAAGLAANQSTNAGSSDPAVQMGLPNGYDLNGGATDITQSPGYPGATGTGADATPIGRYSRPTAIYRDLNGPLFVLTYAQTALLLADAAARGFSVGGTAADYYAKGVSAGIQSMAKFGASATISAGTADAYAAAHPLDAVNALKQINEQYWATTGLFMNFVEAWNNWKRSGYPELTSVNYIGNFSNGTIPRRQLYPTGEATLNSASYRTAITNLSGGDNWTSRVWWDK
jgi:hypothetical protein